MVSPRSLKVPAPSWCQQIDTLFLDLDGCLWFGAVLAPGARETVARLREAGKKVAFISNVSSATRSDIAEKLTALGIPATPADVQVPLELLPQHEYLSGAGNATRGGARGGTAAMDTKVFALCSTRIREALVHLGVVVTDEPTGAEVVLVGRDPEMTYGDLAIAAHALCAGAKLLALNVDSRVPVENGIVVPGTGAIVAALVETTGVAVEVVGKPSPFFFEAALRGFRADRDRTVMVGDTLDTDIAGGRQAGLRTVLVGGGHYSKLPRPPRPDLSVPLIADLLPYFA
jgi:HAD superfamily hydrolase (TIGR01450 family)